MNENIMNENIININNNCNKENYCSICLNDNLNDIFIYKTNCSHIFCKECLDKWFKKGKDSCPLCRNLITTYIHNGSNYRLIIYKATNNNTHLFNTSVNLLNQNDIDFCILQCTSKYPTPLALLVPQDDQIWINYINHWIEIKKTRGYFNKIMEKWNLRSL